MTDGMHWSYLGALRFLRALEGHRWTATTWQILEQTRSVAVHSDAASVRCLFRECGVRDWEGSVDVKRTSETDTGRDVYRYAVREDLRRLAEALLRDALENPRPRGERPDLGRIGLFYAGKQTSLFTKEVGGERVQV